MLAFVPIVWMIWLMWGMGLVVFNPQPLGDKEGYARKYKAWEPFRRTFDSDGERLDGWFREGKGAPLLVFCAGRGRDVASYLASVDSWPIAKLLVNYRGSGASTGWPSEEAVVEDMIHIVETVLSETNRSWKDVVLVGNSLGSGIATHIAYRRQVGRLVLCVPFESFGECARLYVPDFLVSFLVGETFRSDLYAPKIKSPVVILAATNDREVPVRQARRLKERFGNVRYLEFPGGHGSIWGVSEFRNELKQWVCTPLP